MRSLSRSLLRILVVTLASLAILLGLAGDRHPTHVPRARSDQRSYWDQGIPAGMVTDTADVRNPHYHAPGDEAGTLDYGQMAGVVGGERGDDDFGREA